MSAVDEMKAVRVVSRLREPGPFRTALAIMAAYSLVACLWIVSSDYLISLFFPLNADALTIGTVKGVVFVLVSSCLLALLFYRHESARVADEKMVARLLQSLESEVEARTAENQRLIDQRLADCQSRFRALFENHHTIMLLIDPVGDTIFDANPAAAEFYGIPLDRLRGAPLALIDPTPKEQRRQTLLSNLRRDHEGFHLRHQLADGSMRDVEIFAGEVQAEGKSLLFAIVHDVTQRRQTDQLLRLRTSALDTTINMVLITDVAGNIVWANRAFETITGYSVEEALGKNPRELLKSGQHDAAFYRDLWTTITGGQSWSREIINRKKDGSFFTGSMVITPVRDDTLTITHFVAVTEDITARKEMEARFLRAQRLENIGQLAGGIAHDINNILAPILLSVGLLKTENPEPRILSVLETIEASAARGADLVRQILAFARGVEGKRVPLNLRHLVREVEKILRETFPRNISLELDLPTDLPLVLSDPTQIHQLLMNLCVNARDAMPQGGTLSLGLSTVEIDDVFAGMTPGAKPGAFLLLTVRDTGIGMSREILDRIFEPFFTTKAPSLGTGLGLATSHTIVKNHGGFITVQSTPGQGTVFHIYLPVAPDSAPHPPEPLTSAAGIQQERHEGILVVDDEPAILDLACLALRRFNYRVLTARNGAEAVETYTRHRDEIDLVLMDIAMPVMDGHAAIFALRAINPKVLIVTSSGHASANGSDPKVAAFIPKPYTAESLVATLDRVLADQPTTQLPVGPQPPRSHPFHPSRHNATTPDSKARVLSAPPDNAAQ